MSLINWDESVKLAKIKLGLDPKRFTKIQGKLLKEALASTTFFNFSIEAA